MAKITKKVAKGAETDTKLSKVNKKSVTIQKADKKPVKKLKEKAEKTPVIAEARAKKVKPASPKKKAGKAKSLQKKTTPTGGAPIVPKKAKKLAKAGAIGQGKGKTLVSRDDITKAVTAFRTAVNLGLSEKKAMLDPDFRYILQLCSFKIPQCPERIARTQLKHSLVDETDDVCLFVKDLEVGNKRDYQPSIDYYREKLDAAGITNVKAIMPISQIAKDYKQHEMLRKLCGTYDCFLTDGRIAPHLAKKLGKEFVTHKKSPISIRLSHPKLKEHINKAVAKVAYSQTASGDSTAIHIAKHGMDEEKVVENIQQVLENMKLEFPGGWPNIKRVFLRPAINLSKSSIPLYVNASSGENVAVPVIVGPRAKAVAEKQKKLNKLLPDGMIMTNKGELAFVASKKRPAEEAEKEKPAVEKKKSKKDNKKVKKVKEAEVVPVVESAPAAKKSKEPVQKKKAPEPAQKKVVPEPVQKKVVPEPVAEKKGKKDKKSVPVPEAVTEVAPTVEKATNKKSKKAAVVAEVVPVAEEASKPSKKSKKAAVVAEVVPVAEEASKPSKKSKKAAVVAEVVPVTEEPSKPSKKSKKDKVKAAEAEANDANLTKEVSDLWEQIKNESAAELGESEPKKGGNKNKKRKAAAEVVEVEEKKPKGDKKKKK